MSKSGFSQSVRDLAADRSELRCEGCGGRGPFEQHHRQYRSRGGRDVIENDLVLCGWGNHTGCHGDAHTPLGEQRGWSIRSGFDPAEVPFFSLSDGCWYRLGDDGSKASVDAVEAMDFMRDIGAIKEGLVR